MDLQTYLQKPYKEPPPLDVSYLFEDEFDYNKALLFFHNVASASEDLIIPTLTTGDNTRILIAVCEQILAISEPQLRAARTDAAQVIIESQWNIQRVYPQKHEELVTYGLPADHYLFTGLSILTTAAHAKTVLFRSHVASLEDFEGWTKTVLKVANELLKFQNAHGGKILDKHHVLQLTWYLPILDAAWQYPRIAYNTMAQINNETNKVTRGETPLMVQRTNLTTGEVEPFEIHHEYIKEIKKSLYLPSPSESEADEGEEMVEDGEEVESGYVVEDVGLDADDEEAENAHSTLESNYGDLKELQQNVERLELSRDETIDRLEELQRTRDETTDKPSTQKADDAA